MIVKPASRMLSAISFGVFWRLAPAIIRSRNVSPGSEVIRTTSQSDSTRVPPVTALRSPPHSRITGALSPVIALSSTEATPKTTSPSLGMSSPAVTSTGSPRRRSALPTVVVRARPGAKPSSGGVSRRRAVISRRWRRSSSACAAPRPSAIASAKFANSTVNQSQSDTARMKRAGASPCPISACMKSALVSTLPTSTTNMTGLRTWCRGSSFQTARRMARRTIAASRSGRALRWLADMRASVDEHEVLDQRTERQRRQEGERPHDEHDADQQRDEERGVRGQRARPHGHELLLRERARDGERRDREPVARGEHLHPPEEVVEGGVGVEAGEGAAVVVPHRAERVEDLGEAVGSRVHRDP